MELLSPIVANLCIEAVETRFLNSFWGIVAKSLAQMWTIHGSRLEREKYKWTNKSSLHGRRPRIQITLIGLCVACLGWVEGDLDVEVYMKTIHIDQYLNFDSHHPLAHKLGIIRIAKMVATNTNSSKHHKVVCIFSQVIFAISILLILTLLE